MAVSQVRDEVNRMRDMVAKNISDSFDSLVQYDEKLRKKCLREKNILISSIKAYPNISFHLWQAR